MRGDQRFLASYAELVGSFPPFSRNLENSTLIYFAISGPLGKTKFPAIFNSFKRTISRRRDWVEKISDCSIVVFIPT